MSDQKYFDQLEAIRLVAEDKLSELSDSDDDLAAAINQPMPKQQNLTKGTENSWFEREQAKATLKPET